MALLALSPFNLSELDDDSHEQHLQTVEYLHAPNTLLNFVKRMHHWPRHIRIVHGDPRARAALRDLYQSLASDAGHELEVVLPGNG